MKTTVEIPDSLFEAAKAYAQSRRAPFRQIVEEGLRTVLDRARTPARSFRLRDGSFGSRGAAKPLAWPEIRRRIYEGRGE